MRSTRVILAAVLMAAALPCPSAAQTPGSGPPSAGGIYYFGYLGMFSPEGDIDHFDTGFALQGGAGAKVMPNVAIEATAGLYVADGPGSDVWALPVTFGGRLFLPLEVVEPYVGAGFGFYVASFDGAVAGRSADDLTVDLGGYLSGGIDAWLRPDLALSVDLKRHFVEPEFDGVDVGIGGWTFGMGARFLF